MGCDAGDPERQPIDAPPVHVVGVFATTGLDANGTPVQEPVAADGTTVVLPTTSFTVRFDRYILPPDVIRQAICLQSDTTPVADPLNCDNDQLRRPAYNPIRRELTFYLRDEQTRLVEDTVYRLTIFRPLDENALGVRAFDGALLNETVAYQFRVGTNPGDDVPTEQLDTKDLFCQPQSCVDACAPGDEACEAACGLGAKEILGGCASPNCHGSSSTAAASMGLELGSANAIASTALNLVAKQKQTGESASTAVELSRRFGRAMPIIDPGAAANSYLIYKLLATDSISSDPDLAEGEIERLRATVVVGMPMPPQSATAPSREEAARLADWINAGADVSLCPPKP